MRKYLSLIAAALLVTACQNDDQNGAVSGFSTDAIAFSVDEQGIGTRAVNEYNSTDDLKSETSPGFGVFACYTRDLDYNLTSVAPDFMYNQQVKWDETGQEWAYEPMMFWPSNNDEKITFFAYAPFEGAPSEDKCIAAFSGASEQGDPSVVYMLAKERKDQVDLMYAVNDEDGGRPWYNQTRAKFTVDGKMTLSFYHALECAGDTVFIGGDEALLTLIEGYAEVFIDKVYINYTNLASKARLNLNSVADQPSWSTIISGSTTTERTVVLSDEQFPLTAEGKKFEGFGLFYIPIQIGAAVPTGELVIEYTVQTNTGKTYQGKVSREWALSLTTPGVKQDINVNVTDNLDLLHLFYEIIDEAATEPSYSKKH